MKADVPRSGDGLDTALDADHAQVTRAAVHADIAECVLDGDLAAAIGNRQQPFPLAGRDIAKIETGSTDIADVDVDRAGVEVNRCGQRLARVQRQRINAVAGTARERAERDVAGVVVDGQAAANRREIAGANVTATDVGRLGVVVDLLGS